MVRVSFPRHETAGICSDCGGPAPEACSECADWLCWRHQAAHYIDHLTEAERRHPAAAIVDWPRSWG